MTSGTRELMIDGARQLLAERGLQGTSFADVVERTGAPRGSIYHHFPGGKDELVKEALDLAGQRAIAALDGDDTRPEQVAERFLNWWRDRLEARHFAAGCSILAVAIDADTDDLRDHAWAKFDAWLGALEAKLQERGLSEVDAKSAAVLLLAGAEGAIALSRAARSLEPFDRVASELVTRVRELSR